MPKGLGSGVGVGVGALAAGPEGAVAGGIAGAATEEAYDMIVQKVTSASKGSPEYKLFAEYLSEYLSEHPHRLDGMIGLTEEDEEHLQPFEKTYASLHANIAQVTEDIHRDVLMRALARSAVVDVTEDIRHLPNKDTLIGVMKQAKDMTPRQLAILATLSITEKDSQHPDTIDSWAQGPWWMDLDGDDNSTVNERRLYQEMFQMMGATNPLMRHSHDTEFGRRRASSIPTPEYDDLVPKKWTDVEPQALVLTRDGRDFCKILDLQGLDESYRISVMAQISPMGQHLRDLELESPANYNYGLGPELDSPDQDM